MRKFSRLQDINFSVVGLTKYEAQWTKKNIIPGTLLWHFETKGIKRKI